MQLLISFFTFPCFGTFLCPVHTQYVKVANSQKNTMRLGGNLPDSLQPYLMLGSNSHKQSSPKQQEAEVEVVEEVAEKQALKAGSDATESISR